MMHPQQMYQMYGVPGQMMPAGMHPAAMRGAPMPGGYMMGPGGAPRPGAYTGYPQGGYVAMPQAGGMMPMAGARPMALRRIRTKARRPRA